MKNITEYILCRDNIFYFMEKYLEMEMRGIQIDMVTKTLAMQTGQSSNFLGIRQCGVSTAMFAVLLWKNLFHPNNKDAYVSLSDIDSIWAKHTMNAMYSTYLGNWDHNKQACTYMNNQQYQTSLRFDNDSSIFFFSTGGFIRGHSFDLIVFENMYIYPNSGTALSQIAPSCKKFVIANTSLPEKEHPLEQVGMKSTYPWYCNPDFDLKWYLANINSLEMPDFLRNYGCTRG